jgi:ferredoxin
LAPEVFGQDVEDGLVVVLNSTPEEDQRDDVDEAIQTCPAQAIRLEYANVEQTGQGRG